LANAVHITNLSAIKIGDRY